MTSCREWVHRAYLPNTYESSCPSSLCARSSCTTKNKTFRYCADTQAAKHMQVKDRTGQGKARRSFADMLLVFVWRKFYSRNVVPFGILPSRYTATYKYCSCLSTHHCTQKDPAASASEPSAERCLVRFGDVLAPAAIKWSALIDRADGRDRAA